MRKWILAIVCTFVSLGSASAAWDGLDELNAARARRGLRPYICDPELTRAAAACAEGRAARLWAGHCNNDFSALPPGARANATGCGALTADWGWQTCCQYDNYMYAGAAWTWGRDGKRYMHVFCR